MEQCIDLRLGQMELQRFYPADPPLYAEGLCLGEQVARERGIEDPEDYEWFFNDFARAYASTFGLPRKTVVDGIIVQPAEIAESVAYAQMDFRQRCENSETFGWLVGPRDYGMYAERVAETGKEASERYLPCTLQMNDEISGARDLDDVGQRYYAAP